MNHNSRYELIEFLRELDKRHGKHFPGRKTTLYIFGGAAVVAYGSRRATVDLDVYLEDREIQKKLLEWGGHGSALQRKYGFHMEGANTTIMLIEDPEWRERSVEIFKRVAKSLIIRAPSREDLILSKLSRYSDKDRADIQFIVEKFKVNPKKLIDYYKSARPYYVGNLRTLDLTFNIVLKEHFSLKPRNF